MTSMKNSLTRVCLGGALVAAAVALSGCAGPAGYGNGYGQYSCSRGNCAGNAYFSGTWRNNNRYRNDNGGRQYRQGGGRRGGQGYRGY